ncbi:hypothetical protein GC176_00585 [bacterium]|nr:hypothetical protein [bacterium]
MTSTPQSDQRPSADPKRLRWYRRPWVLLSLTGLALLASTPFAIRGYQLSLIPDIADPFADLPPVRMPPEKTDEVVERFVNDMKEVGRAVDDVVSAEEGFALETRDLYYRNFDEEIRAATEQGLAVATPRVRKYLDDHEFVIQEGLAALRRVGDGANPGEVYYGIGRYYPDILGLSIQRLLQTGDADEAVDLLIQVIDAVENTKWYCDVGRYAGEDWSHRLGTRVQLWKLAARLSELPGFGEEHIRRLLASTRSLQPISLDAQLELVHASYLEDREEYEDDFCYWACAEYLSLPQSVGRPAAFVLGEPELARRILKHFYARYRTQIEVPRPKRGVLREWSFADDADWISDSVTKNEYDLMVETAARHSPMFCMDGASIQGWLLGFDAESKWIRQLQTVVACQLHLRRTGSLPPDLESLVPDYLPEIPIDSFSPTGEAMIYRCDGAEAELYSVWRNGVDDGGIRQPGEKRRGNDDRGFIIRDRISSRGDGELEISK